MSRKGVAKSLGLTLLGIVLFLVKLPGIHKSFFNWAVATIEGWLAPINGWVLFFFIGFALAGTVAGTVFHWKPLLEHPLFGPVFKDKKMQLVTLIVAFAVIVSYLFLPIEILNTESAALVTLCANMVVFMVVAKLVLPLLSDYGLAEMLEVFLRPIMKPLLKVPGAAVMNMLTGIFVSVTVGVVMCIDQFEKSIYNRREAVIIISCLTVPSMPFVMLMLQTVGEADSFGRFYPYMLVCALLVSVIAVRILPIARIPETYKAGASALADGENRTEPRWKIALTDASQKALATKYHPVHNVVTMILNMISFIPYTLAWGTLMKLILAHTNIVAILTWPYAMWLQLFGIPDAHHFSPMIVLNMIDVVMPSVLFTDLNQPELTMKLLCMTLGEMVYTAPLLLALGCAGLTNLKEQAGIWLVRLILLVPAATLLFRVFLG